MWASAMSCIADTRVAMDGVAFVSSTVVMVCSPVLSISVSVLGRQKQGRVAAASFGDYPQRVLGGSFVAAHQPKAFFQTELIFLPVVFGNFAPVARHVAREKFRGGLAGFFESGQRAGCSDELAQVKQRTSFCFLHLDKLLGLNLGFAPKRRGEKPRIRNKSLRGEVRRLSVRAVKAAGWAFIGAERRALTEGADGSGAGF